MIENPITFPDVGCRVWTFGLQQHGPVNGPKTDVLVETGGTIVGFEKPYYTMDIYLYSVQWDTGERTKHYFSELLCIGPFRTLSDFKQAILTDGERAKLTLGPVGGFRGFSMYLRNAGTPLLIQYTKDHKRLYDWLIEPLIKQAGISVEVEQLCARESSPRTAPRRRRRAPARPYGSTQSWSN